jgi:hypothetical protein
VGIQEVVVSKELESFWARTLEEVPSMKECSKALPVVTAWDGQVSVELRVIEDCQSEVNGLPMDECLVLGVEELMQSFPVFEERRWS